MNDPDYSLDDLLWFLRVAQTGSLSSAATQLAVPKSTLSRRLARIEEAIGVMLVPTIANYLLEHPQVLIETELADRKVHLINEGFDFAVRIDELPDSGLRARHFGMVQSKISASVVLRSESRTVTALLPARLVAGPSDNLLVPVQMGVGISALPEIQVAPQLRSGELVRVLPDWEMPELEVRVLYPAQRRLPPATRSVIEYFSTRVPQRISQLLQGGAGHVQA